MAVTKELMGHSSIGTTMKFYDQVDELHQAQACQVMQHLLESAQKAN